MTKLLSEMSLKELWQLFPIILKEHDPEYKRWYLAEAEVELIKTKIKKSGRIYNGKNSCS